MNGEFLPFLKICQNLVLCSFSSALLYSPCHLKTFDLLEWFYVRLIW